MQKILILDFGGQYNQLIARRVRENRVYCEVHPWSMPLEEIRRFDPVGIIFTGGPRSVYDPTAPHADARLFALGVPILGICYGCQLLAQTLGGSVSPAQTDTAREYGKTVVRFDPSCTLFSGLPGESVVWMSHGDYIAGLPEGFSRCAESSACPCAGICDEARGFYGVQFHPEVNHTEYGRDILKNFLFLICRAAGDWTMEDFRRRAVGEIRRKVGSGRVLLALSGGVDSSVAAALLSEAVGDQLTCVFVDHGLLRLNEADEVMHAFSGRRLRLVRVDAQARFLRALSGVSEPERKRKIIGEEFIRVFEEESRKIGAVDFLAQGTIYPDVIESGSGSAAVIKSHHNVGGLPDVIAFREILEPLRRWDWSVILLVLLPMNARWEDISRMAFYLKKYDRIHYAFCPWQPHSLTSTEQRRHLGALLTEFLRQTILLVGRGGNLYDGYAGITAFFDHMDFLCYGNVSSERGKRYAALPSLSGEQQTFLGMKAWEFRQMDNE